MLPGFSGRQRIGVLEEKVEILSGRLEESQLSADHRLDMLDSKTVTLSNGVEEMMAGFARLSADLDRFTSALDRVQQRLTAESLNHREQMDRLSTVHGLVAQLQAEGVTASDVAAQQGSVLDKLQKESLLQERSLAQISVDITRIERQAAADLEEFRTTNTAIARIVLAPAVHYDHAVKGVGVDGRP